MQNQKVLACCDENILGKNLKEGKYDVTIDADFYKGKKTSEKEMKELLKEADSVNLFGEKSVGVALKEGLIKDSQVIKIKGIKHAILLRL